METCKTRTIVRAVLKKQEASPDLFSNRTGSSHKFVHCPTRDDTRRACHGETLKFKMEKYQIITWLFSKLRYGKIINYLMEKV